MQLKDIMATDIQVVSPNDSIMEAAQIMEEYNVGAVPVCDEQSSRLLGVVTDRDIVVRNVARGKTPTDGMVESVMSSEVRVGRPDMDVHEAAEIMADNQIRRLPVVEGEKIVGIVSLGDLAVQTRLVDDVGQVLSNVSKNY